MAGGGTIEIPPGNYRLQDCNIPVAANVTLVPLGPVRILVPAAGNAGLFYNAGSAVSSSVTVSNVTSINTWPVNNVQTLTKIDGTFSGFSVGDVCHIMSNDTSFDGFTKGEMFKVAYVHSDNSYIIADRALFYSYNAGTYTTSVRRLTAGKLRILPGIILDTVDDPLTNVSARPFGLLVRGAIEPEITIAADSTYATSVRLQGVYGGRVDFTANRMPVNYDIEAYGYGLELKGASHGTVCRVYGDGGGHIFVANGDMTTYSTAVWYRTGVPQNPVIEEFYSRNAVASPLDMHWAIKPRVVSAVIEDAFRDATVARSSQHGLFIGAIDPWIGNVSVKNCLSLLTIRDHKGLPTTYRIDNANYEATVQSPGTPALIKNDIYSQVGGSRPVVEIGGGRVAVTDRFPILASGSHDDGYTLRLRNVVFYGSPGLVWYNSATYPAYIEFHDGCTWYPDGSTSTDGILRADATCPDGRVKVYSLKILRNGGTYPNGLVRANASITCSVMVGSLTVDGSPLPVKTSGAAGTSVVTITKPTIWGENVQAPTGSATVDDDAGLVLMSHTSGTPTITLRDPSLFPGRRVTIKNLALSSGGNVTVATAAGTIDGATTLMATGKERATYIANGTVWQQIE
jgi:hypothetical protein